MYTTSTPPPLAQTPTLILQPINDSHIRIAADIP
ncbi:hypothetical protein Tco_1452650, partial [Tanacetum coccineum]